ncbi:ABC transporter permease [Cryobacterium melibiosiphilum]|uniref:ABC transporter permease n=1 Tax=Cryobacterium melibiosiphilum TaxID=995039 RepID=A0A3A5MCB0_9MICO|nr:ABC transporter permease [Cryobacterium melibiosiphilum]RJT87767.1 ABC transporter permease [Cryobacterium melibiosiphilum]
MTSTVTAGASPALRTTVLAQRNWKTAISLLVFALLGLIGFGLLGQSSDVTFNWTGTGDDVIIPNWVEDSKRIGVVFGILMLAITGVSVWFTWNRTRPPAWLVLVFGLLFVTALLASVGAGGRVPVIYLATGAISFAVPVILGAVAGVMGERVGVVNIAIEGQLLLGAFMAAIIGTMTGNLFLGIASAMIGGALVAMILASFSIKYLVDQIIIGVVLNVLVAGITSFFYSAVMTRNSEGFNFPGTLSFLAIPGLSDIPLIGPILFDNRITTYAVFVIVPLVGLLMYKTRWGLRLRAVGEHPLAADTVGINVNRTRFRVMTLAGLIAGLGGAALSIGAVGPFIRDMSAGQGYIALACVILGRWNPWYAATAALMFGFARIFQVWAGQAGSGIPADFIAMIPYLVTLVAVAGFVGKSIGPAAAGKAYVKQ